MKLNIEGGVVMPRSVALMDKLFSIGQVNAVTGVPKSTIRFWEKEFCEFLVPHRTRGNQRRYDKDAVKTLKIINQLVNEDGYTLEGARRKLESRKCSVCEESENDAENTNFTSNLLADHLILHKLLNLVKTKKSELEKVFS